MKVVLRVVLVCLCVGALIVTLVGLGWPLVLLFWIDDRQWMDEHER